MDSIYQSEFQKLKKVFIVILAGWTMLILLSLAYELQNEYNQAQQLARNEVQVSFKKDLLYRRWAAMHGGVYAPMTPKTPANEYLKNIPERDIITPKGKKLTLINPAYMTRQVYELGGKQFNIKGHITSLHPIRPLNKPDRWEKESLLQIEKQHLNEVYGIDTLDNKPYLRYIQPLYVEKSCLKCHSGQGYKVGDIRGGLCVSVPMQTYNNLFVKNSRKAIVFHLAIWLIFFLILLKIFFILKKELKQRSDIQQQLSESNERFQLLSDITVEGIIIHDKGVCKDANQSFCNMFGYAREDLIGKNIIAMIIKESYWPICNKQIQDDYSLPYVVEAHNIDGKTIPVELESRKFTFNQKEYKVVAFRDLSERKQQEQILAESEEKLRKLIEQSTDAIIITNTSGHITEWNNAAEHITGIDKQQAVNMFLGDALGLVATPETMGKIKDKLTRLSSFLLRNFNINNIEELHLTNKKDHTLRVIQVIIFDVKTSKGTILASIARDITLQKQSEQKLKELIETKDKLMSIIAHDLRNPFMNIIGFAQLLSENINQMDMAKSTELAQHIYHSASRTYTLLEELLLWAKSQAGKLNMSMDLISLDEIIQHNIDSAKQQARIKEIELTSNVDDKINIVADRNMLNTIIRNVLSNAIKYTPIGGKVELQVTSKGDDIQISIADNGVGMDEKKISSLFKVSEKISTPGTANEKGSGLGLLLTHEFIEKHHGKIWVKSAVNEGTTFFISIPKNLNINKL